jgi:hypothetical protein
MIEAIGVSNLSCAVICGKWALDLGFSQSRQILFVIAGLILGPLVLLELYVRLIRKARDEGSPGGKAL